MKCCRLSIFIFQFFFLFSVALNAKIITFPKDCDIELDKECSLKIVEFPQKLELEKAALFISAGSIVLNKGLSDFYLNNGFYHVKAKSDFRIQTRFGNIDLKSQDEVLIDIEFENMIVNSISGVIHYGGVKGPSYLLPAGYSNSIAWPNLNSQEQVGIPSAINIQNLILKLHVKLNYSSQDIRIALSPIKSILPNVIEERSQRYLASVYEALESQEIERSRQAKSRAIRKLEEKKIREEFFRKTFLE